MISNLSLAVNANFWQKRKENLKGTVEETFHVNCTQMCINIFIHELSVFNLGIIILGITILSPYL
jgi:hypothetical protein